MLSEKLFLCFKIHQIYLCLFSLFFNNLFKVPIFMFLSHLFLNMYHKKFTWMEGGCYCVKENVLPQHIHTRGPSHHRRSWHVWGSHGWGHEVRSGRHLKLINKSEHQHMYMCEPKALESLVRCFTHWAELPGASIWSGLTISDHTSTCLM